MMERVSGEIDLLENREIGNHESGHSVTFEPRKCRSVE